MSSYTDLIQAWMLLQHQLFYEDVPSELTGIPGKRVAWIFYALRDIDLKLERLSVLTSLNAKEMASKLKEDKERLEYLEKDILDQWKAVDDLLDEITDSKERAWYYPNTRVLPFPEDKPIIPGDLPPIEISEADQEYDRQKLIQGLPRRF